MPNVWIQITPADAVTGCSVWTREENRAARNGVFYGLKSESDCMAACLTSTICVAIDLGPVGCTLHSIEDLSDAYNASGVTQFSLHRECLPTTTRSENFTETAGIQWFNLFMILLCLARYDFDSYTSLFTLNLYDFMNHLTSINFHCSWFHSLALTLVIMGPLSDIFKSHFLMPYGLV